MFTCVQMDSNGKTTLARSEKGRVMTVNEGGVPVFDAAVLAGENPVLMVGNGRIVLAPTSRGSIITYSWPRLFPAPKDFDCTQYSTEFKIHKVRRQPADPQPVVRISPAVATSGCQQQPLPSLPGDGAGCEVGFAPMNVIAVSACFAACRAPSWPPRSASTARAC